MLRLVFYLVSILIIVSGAFVYVSAQAEDAFPGEHRRRREEQPPIGVREMLEKMRIDKDIKDHDEAVSRGEEVIKLTADIEKTYSASGQISGADREKLQEIEKNVKKIRSELGGSDDDEKIDEIVDSPGGLTVATAVTALKTSTETLWDEMNKSSRFSISVPAIEASNATLKIIQFLLRK